MPANMSFLSMPAPEGYVAGLGRGATGFTTRSDLGPNIKKLTEEDIKDLTEREREKREAREKGEGQDDEDENRQNPDDEHGLLAGLGLETEEDREADSIYAWVDQKMASRNKKRKAAEEEEERARKAAKEDPLKAAFADVKRGLANMTDDDWASIPDPGDLTQKNKRERQEAKQRFYAVPDAVLAGSAGQSQYNTSIDDGADGTKAHNFAAYGTARKNRLESKLDTSGAKAEDSSAVNSQKYLEELTSTEALPDQHNMGDIRRIRELMTNVTKSNPTHAPGWMAAARLEELAGKVVAARNLTTRGVELCPKSEDLWLEHMRLHENSDARIIAKEALSRNDRSVRLWLAAADLEKDDLSRQRVLRKAVEHVNSSIELWKSLIKLEQTDDGAKLLLAKAVEFIPRAEELWLALARLEDPLKAQQVLNKARKLMPESYKVWVAAVNLQEQMGKGLTLCNKLMESAVKALSKENVMPSRETWLEEAAACEVNELYDSVQAIVDQTIGWKVPEEDRQDLWLSEAQSMAADGKYHTARAIYRHALRIYVNVEKLWTAAVEHEKNHGPEDKSTLYELLDQANEAVPESERLWIQNATERHESGDVEGTHVVLARAFRRNPKNERIWLAAVKIETDARNVDRARKILAQARVECDTDRVYLKSAHVERQQGEPQQALDLINEGIPKFPKNAKMYVVKGQIYQFDMKPPNIPAAREAYSTGTRECPTSPLVWIMLARLEETHGVLVKARSVLDRARTKLPKDPSIWLESVRLERRAGEKSAAMQKMSQALQAVPPKQSGLLETEKLWYQEPRNNRKQAALQGIKKLESDAMFFCSVARIFWLENRQPKARNWFEKAIRFDPMQGDAWAWYLAFLQKESDETECKDLIAKCVAIRPTHGETWASIAKAPRNWDKSVEEILHLTVAGLDRAGMGGTEGKSEAKDGKV